MKSQNTDELKFMVDIARLYYREQMTQSQIAKRLHVSRSLVSKLLVRSREIGLVEIVIHEDKIRPYQDLEDRLKHLFALKEVICVDPQEGESSDDSIAIHAGKYLASRFASAKSVAVSGGRTMYNVAKQFMPSVALDHLTFVPMVGGIHDELWELQANTVCEYFASHCNATSLPLHAPVIVDSAEAKNILIEQRFIKATLNQAKNADIAVVGIGTGKRYFEIANKYLPSEQHLTEKMRREIQGDMIFNLFDKNGKLIDCPWNHSTISLSLEDMKHIPEVIGIAGDSEKARAIYIAIQNKYLNSLIITADLGQQILKLHSKYL